jgi:lysine-specific histone demethylase 1
MGINKDRIIVIGAGISGLACAREFQHRGHEVLVVEARSRVGGRLKGESIRSSSSSSCSKEESIDIDVGGALIHGIDKNPVHTIANQMGVPLRVIDEYCLLLDDNGWPFDPKEDEKTTREFNLCLDQTFQKIASLPITDRKQQQGSFGKLFQETCQELGYNSSSLLWKWHQENLELPTGASFEDLGYSWNDDEPYGFSGDHAAITTSWKWFCNQLAKGLDIVYESPVKTISIVSPDGTIHHTPPTLTQRKQQKTFTTASSRTRWSSRHTTINSHKQEQQTPSRRSSRTNKGKITVTNIQDTTTQCYDSNHKNRGRERNEKVQITLQDSTVLEANAVVCTLPLGVLKTKQITFEPPLPNNKCEAIEKLGCGLLNKCVLSFSTVFWQDSDFLGLAGHDHSYLVLNAHTYTQKPVLIFMFGGSFAKTVEYWTDQEIVQDCLSVLTKICGKRLSSHKPLDYCVTRWGKDPHSRMAFTYVPPGVEGPQQLANMAQAITSNQTKKPLIMFAGEHTTPYHPSTMHGAFLTGIREAYRYDLWLNPELNDHLVFQENSETMYVHTFPTRKSYTGNYTATTTRHQATQLSPIPSSNNTNGGNTIRSRQSRFAGMTLRKKPKETEILTIPTFSPPRESKNGTATTPSSTTFKTTLATTRRSQRSLSFLSSVIKSAKNEERNQPNNDNTQQDSLQDRILSRSLQSYGRNYALIKSKILPVFGSTSKQKLSTDQIRSRWQSLSKKEERTEKINTTKWIAKTIAEYSTSVSSTYRSLKRGKKIK